MGKHCLATGHSVSTNNVRVLSREQEWHRRKVKEAIYIKQQGPTMNRDQGYQLPPPPIYSQILPPVSGSSQIEMLHRFKQIAPKYVLIYYQLMLCFKDDVFCNYETRHEMEITAQAGTSCCSNFVDKETRKTVVLYERYIWLGSPVDAPMCSMVDPEMFSAMKFFC